jgi:hypothetical protein
MTDLLREPLGEEQLQLLRVIYEPFGQAGLWPVWQYVDLTLDDKYGTDGGEVLASLPRLGGPGPMSMSYGLTWREDSQLSVPNPGHYVTLTVAGLWHLRPATEPLLLAFFEAIRCMIEAQRRLVPSPSEVVEASVQSGAISRRLVGPMFGVSLDLLDVALRKIRRLLSHEPFLHLVHQPKPDIEDWSVRVPAVLRVYRDITSIDDYLDCVAGQVAPPEPPAAPPSPSPLDIPYAVGYLDAVWKAKTGSRLFASLDAASVGRLTLQCGTEAEFNSLMSALADVLAQVTEPGHAQPPQGGALEKVREYLSQALDAAAAVHASDAIDQLIKLRRIRVSAQHSDARHKAVTAFRDIGLSFPPASWWHAWDHVAGPVAGALDTVREEAHAGLP